MLYGQEAEVLWRTGERVGGNGAAPGTMAGVPLDPTLAGLIGAGIGAAATAAGAMVSALVARANVHRQLLYAKRLETYEALARHLRTVLDDDPLNYKRDDDVWARVHLYGSQRVKDKFFKLALTLLELDNLREVELWDEIDDARRKARRAADEVGNAAMSDAQRVPTRSGRALGVRFNRR
jgi:hypothetical protein